VFAGSEDASWTLTPRRLVRYERGELVAELTEGLGADLPAAALRELTFGASGIL
jgi:hypothetical protein